LRRWSSAAAVLGMPAGKRLAPFLPELVGVLRKFGELDIDDDTEMLLIGMSAATIDRRLAPERRKHELRGRSHTKPGSLLKSQIPIRTWADWDDARPGFVEIDLVGHEGGKAAGEHAYTLTVTDIATGWAENRSVPNKARKWVLTALDEIAKTMPFPILGVDSDNGSKFINHHLLAWCENREITFTRSRPGNSNDGCHVEQKNWAIVRTVVGYHRYDTAAELLLLNKIWALQSKLANYFCSQQKLVSKVRAGAQVSKKYDTATTPHRRAERHDAVADEDKTILADTYASINRLRSNSRSRPSPPSCSRSPQARQDAPEKPPKDLHQDRSPSPATASPRFTARAFSSPRSRGVAL
jgi:hypothetical protein